MRTHAGRWILGLLAALPLFAQYDVLIRHGRIVDGTGDPWFYGDIAIRGDRIAAVGLMPQAEARQVIDATGLVVAPGFVDIHSHGDRGIFRTPAAENYVYQGVTTFVGGNDGGGSVPLSPMLDKLAAVPKSVNVGSFVGQGSLRSSVMGLVNRPATRDELARMVQLADQAMRDGAFGLSTGLFYVPGNFTPTEEVIAIAKAIAPYGGIHISHMRSESDGTLDSVRETIRIGEDAGLPTQITHHKIIGGKFWGLSEQTLRLVAEARVRGVDVTIDQYPYTASSTGIAALFPQWSLEGGAKSTRERLEAPAQRSRIKAEIVRNILENRGGGDPKNVVIAGCPFDPALAGKSLADLAKAQQKEPTAENAAEVAMDLQKRGGCSAIYHAISEQDIVSIMKSPFTMIASDGEIPVFGQENPHPRGYGTFARVLARYVRDQHVISLEEAVRKMSGFPAARLRLMDRGLLRPGMMADVIVFDPATVADRASFQQTHQYAVGMRHVIVNGEWVMKDGKLTTARPGRVLFGPGKKEKAVAQSATASAGE